MTTIHPTISDIINSNQPENALANFSNPKPILQQRKSVITTNPFIKPTDDSEIEVSENIKKKRISQIFMGFFDDLFYKPSYISWSEYMIVILYKDSRYKYITGLLIIIVLYILLIK